EFPSSRYCISECRCVEVGCELDPAMRFIPPITSVSSSPYTTPRSKDRYMHAGRAVCVVNRLHLRLKPVGMCCSSYTCCLNVLVPTKRTHHIPLLSSIKWWCG